MVAPGPLGVGGLGAAARDALDGLTAHGFLVEKVGAPEPAGVLRRAAHERPLRRWPAIGRSLTRRATRSAVARDWDLAWAVPGYLPASGPIALHQATFHPDTVRASLAAARAETRGGSGFIGRSEAALLCRELRRAAVIRTESMEVAHDLAERGVPADRLVCVPPGVDLERFRPAPKADRLTVAFVGTLSLWKGVDVLADLKLNLPDDIELRVIGGPVCAWSRRVSERAAFAQDSSVDQLLARSHALVLPSVTDGFGYVVLEAMASGAVPFVTPTVGAADLVREIDARLVQPRGDFAQAVPELLRTLPIEAMGRRAREVAEQYERRQQASKAIRAILDRVRD